MESSNWPKRLSKQGYTLDRPQHHLFRCTDPKSYLEDEDSFEPSIRHTYRKQVTRSEQGARSLSGSMGTSSKVSED